MYKSPISLALTGIFLVSALFIQTLSLFIPIQASPVANQITVTTTADIMDAFDGYCSLREAVHNANNNVQYSPEPGECPPGDGATTDVIVLQSGQTYSLTLGGSGDDEGDLTIWPGGTAVIDLRLETDGAATAVIEMTAPGYRVMQNDGATVEIDNILLSGGTVDGPGGGILNQSGGHLTLTNVVLHDNDARNGGGLYNLGTAVLINSQIMTNTATINGGGLVNRGGGSLTLDGGQVMGNRANQNGGGIYHLDDASTLTITGSDVISNTAVNGDGGGLFMLADGAINQSAFVGNTAVNGVGGGVYNGGAVLNGQAAVLSGNQALAGGGLYNANGGLHLTGGSFVNNQALTDGGGLYAHGGMVAPNLTGIIFEANQADSGAGLYLAAGTTTHLRQTAVVHNQAAAMGGGIFAGGDLILGNVTLSGNGAADGGGLYILAGGMVTAVNITLALNDPGQNLHQAGQLSLGNSILSAAEAPGCLFADEEGAILSLGHNRSDDPSCVGLDEPTDMIAAVLLAPLDNYYSDLPTHALLPGSPALNAGDNAACAAFPVNGVDQRGLRRPYGPICDVGAHEEQPPFQLYVPVIQR
jgi:CSLREA domain-containing protein